MGGKENSKRAAQISGENPNKAKKPKPNILKKKLTKELNSSKKLKSTEDSDEYFPEFRMPPNNFSGSIKTLPTKTTVPVCKYNAKSLVGQQINHQSFGHVARSASFGITSSRTSVRPNATCTVTSASQQQHDKRIITPFATTSSERIGVLGSPNSFGSRNRIPLAANATGTVTSSVAQNHQQLPIASTAQQTVVLPTVQQDAYQQTAMSSRTMEEQLDHELLHIDPALLNANNYAVDDEALQQALLASQGVKVLFDVQKQKKSAVAITMKIMNIGLRRHVYMLVYVTTSEEPSNLESQVVLLGNTTEAKDLDGDETPPAYSDDEESELDIEEPKDNEDGLVQDGIEEPKDYEDEEIEIQNNNEQENEVNAVNNANNHGPLAELPNHLVNEENKTDFQILLSEFNSMREEFIKLREDIGILKEIVENRPVGEVGVVGVRAAPTDLLPEFPINDVETFERFNNDLETNDRMRSQLMEFLRDHKAKKAEKAVRIALGAIISNELGCKYNWIGIHEHKKMSGLRFTKCVTDAFKGINGATIGDIEGLFKDWLRRSGDRLKLEKKANEKNKQ